MEAVVVGKRFVVVGVVVVAAAAAAVAEHIAMREKYIIESWTSLDKSGQVWTRQDKSLKLLQKNK